MKAYARIDGALLGLLWVASFACFIGNFAYPLLGFLWMAVIVATPFFVGRRICRFRDRVLDGNISFRRSFAYSVFNFFYAALIFAIVQWMYFQFLDNGYFFSHYFATLKDPQFKEMLRASGVTVSEAKEMLDAVSSLRPIDIAMQVLWMNIFAGAILSVFIGLFTMRNRPVINSQE